MIYTPLLSRYDGTGGIAGPAWTGVVRVHDRRVSGSAVLLASGLHLLTAAHLVDDFDLVAGEVIFETKDGVVTRGITAVAAYPGAIVNGSGVWHDLALITLSQAAPVAAERYAIYDGVDEVGRVATVVGYGAAQNVYGVAVPEAQATRRAGLNTIDATGASLVGEGWQGSLTGQLFFDYDDNTIVHDTLGSLLGIAQLGLGGAEAMLTPGDSGGGLFIEQDGVQLLAGINSFVTRYESTDISSAADGSVGDMGAVTRVSSYAGWIAKETGQAQTPFGESGDPPETVTVPLRVVEGQGVWFLVQLSHAATQQAMVDFSTRDGTALAGFDYIPTSGILSLDEGERWAKIWVQTLADNLIEGEETFSLVLRNPVGAGFADGIIELTAMRTIVDNIILTGVTQLIPDLFV